MTIIFHVTTLRTALRLRGSSLGSISCIYERIVICRSLLTIIIISVSLRDAQGLDQYADCNFPRTTTLRLRGCRPRSISCVYERMCSRSLLIIIIISVSKGWNQYTDCNFPVSLRYGAEAVGRGQYPVSMKGCVICRSPLTIVPVSLRYYTAKGWINILTVTFLYHYAMPRGCRLRSISSIYEWMCYLSIRRNHLTRVNITRRGILMLCGQCGMLGSDHHMTVVTWSRAVVGNGICLSIVWADVMILTAFWRRWWWWWWRS